MELRGRSHLKDWLYSEPGNWLSEVTACISVSMQEFGDPSAMKPVTGLGGETGRQRCSGQFHMMLSRHIVELEAREGKAWKNFCVWLGNG